MKVKSKIAFGLTKRQLICVGLAVIVGIPFYWFSRKTIGDDLAFYIMFAFVLPIGMAGFYQPQGMPFEKYVMHIIRWRYLRPRTRCYYTNNLYEQVENRIKIEKEFQKYVLFNKAKAAQKAAQKLAYKDRSRQSVNATSKKANR